MSNWESAKHGYAELTQLIAQYVDEGPSPSLRFGRANELADSHPSHAFEAPGPAKLCERSIDLPDEGIDRLYKENRPGEARTTPSDSPSDGAQGAPHQIAGCRSLNRDDRGTLTGVLMNDL